MKTEDERSKKPMTAEQCAKRVPASFLMFVMDESKDLYVVGPTMVKLFHPVEGRSKGPDRFIDGFSWDFGGALLSESFFLAWQEQRKRDGVRRG